MSVNITAAVVIYNKSCSDSLTFNCVEKARKPENFKLLVLDNSTSDQKNESLCAENGSVYISMNGNSGLSKAYNRALREIKKSGGCDIVVWLDDDTEIPADYFERLSECAEKHPEADIFMPLVASGEDIISPSVVSGARVLRIKDLSELDGKEVTAINSGLSVRMSVYDDYRYDEALFLDLVDHKFNRDCNARGLKRVVVEGQPLRQTFFGDTNRSKKAALAREKIFAADFKTYGKMTGKSPLVTWAQLLRRRIKINRTCK